MPVTMVSCKFLDNEVRGGVSPSFRDKLLAADSALRASYASSPQIQPWKDWHNVKSVAGYRSGMSHHARGEAIDIGYSWNGYGVTRTGTTLGGEWQGRNLSRVRERAMEAFDAIMGRRASLGAWITGESATSLYQRIETVNAATQVYFAPYFRRGSGFTSIKRRPAKDYWTAPVEAFAPMVASGELLVGLQDVPLDVLRHYEAIRIPLVIGGPEARPGETRNPANGFMNLREHVVVALCDVGGLRWGGMFGKHESGDWMHFDSARRISG